MKKNYKDLLIFLMIMPVIIAWWKFSLTAPIEIENNGIETVEITKNEQEILNQNDIFKMNQNTILVPVKAMELVQNNEPYFFLRNNDGDVFISDNQELKHNQNYVLEIDALTFEIIEYRFDINFTFTPEDEEIFKEWFDSDIEQGKEMLNEYLGIEDYTENAVSI